MSNNPKGFIRAWNEFDLIDIEKNLIVVGELSSECYSCHEIGIKTGSRACPSCGAYFKYMGFRRKLQPSYLKKVKEESPSTIMIDFEDFKKCVGKRDAQKLFGS